MSACNPPPGASRPGWPGVGIGPTAMTDAGNDGVSIDAAPKRPAHPAPHIALPDPHDPPSSTPPAGRRRPSALLVAAAVIVTALAVGAVSYATTQSEHTQPRPASSAPATGTSNFPLSAGQLNQRAALAWMAANLPRSTTLLTDPTMSGRLIALGFATVLTTPAATLPGYVVSDRALRANGASNAVLARSVPVARFGLADAMVEVRSVLRTTTARLTAVLAADRANRRLAGTALASNPKLSATPAVRTVLRDGGLDLRAATYLALVASDTKVRVTDLPIDPAEAAASRPRRVVTLATTGAAATAIRAAAAALPPDYAPARDTATADSLTLTWSANAQPVEPVT